MIYRMLLTCMAIIILGFLLTCTQKTRSADSCLFLVAGDTVSLPMVNRIVPDSLPWPKKLWRAALELACVKVFNKASPAFADSQRATQMGSELAQQLSRQGGETWTPEAGMNLYIAAQCIAERAYKTNALSEACVFADSLFTALVVVADSAILQESRKKKATTPAPAPVRRGDPASLEPLMTFLFDLPSPVSQIVAEFVATAGSEPKPTVDLSSTVKGLVFDSTRQKEKKLQPTAVARAAVVQENSKEALRYRNKESIKDSIEKHIPNLEALYKKHLKTHPDMQGTVWVTFSIRPNGRVMNAQVKTSSITEKKFLFPFRDYVIQKIRFQSIPEKAGNMSVEFPFEFTPVH